MAVRLMVFVSALLLTLTSLVPVVGFVPLAEAGVVQQIDEEVPPGNPVIGDDRPGDGEPENDTNYALWVLLALCLIGAGILLVKIERWEARRLGGEPANR